jgi:DNA topoisomerase I
MAKNLVIVESPGKVKAIGKYLGKDFLVKASLGHVKDLPKRNLSVDVDNDFKPVYEVIESKRKLISELKTAAKSAENIYLAADPDREGEAICFHLQEELENKKSKIFRVMFNEITKGAVQKAFEKPLAVNLHLVDAQQARRILDRLVGYKISPLLWDKVRRGLSAGRVQTVALRLIVEREQEILAFLAREYWSIDVGLGASKPPTLKAHLAKKNDENAEIGNDAEAKAILDALDGAAYTVKSVTNREKRRNPAAPFITSTLQQEGARKCRFSVKRTMMLAQKLYEGVELSTDEGQVGLISYMRTDSVRVSNDALDEVRGMIVDRYGADYRPANPIVYKGKKDAQDAHEAIRPTSVLRTPEDVAPFLQEDELKLYRLIWMRFVASQMTPAVFDQTTIDVEAKGKDGASYIFRATGSVEKFDGFLKVYEEGKDQKDEDDDELKAQMPAVVAGEVLKFISIEPEQHFTEPPPRFTEATLVKELESDGVGRPSTYASILSTIQEREYVRKDGGKFFPTELGLVVEELLLESFKDLFDVTYTARMEAELDEIEEGKLDWRMAMSEFYERFSKDLDHATKHMTDVKRMEVPTDFKCEKCDKPMVIKWGRHGKFIACTGYPDFSPRSAESDFEGIRKEIGKQQERAQKEAGKRVEREARYQTELEKLDQQIVEKKLTDRKVAEQRKKIKARLDADLEKLETKRLEQQAKDQTKIKLRVKVLQARYPGLAQFYHLDLADMETFGKRNERFCTYSREIPSDQEEPDSGNLDEAVMCDNCGRPMVLKKGRFGQFLACSAYPDCKTTKQLGAATQQQDVTLDEKCPNCNSNMVRKYGRFGEFVACSNYPTCKYVKQKTIGVKCPNCSEGEVVERRSKRGKTFYGCNRYPDCDFVAWGKPLPEKCPECGGAYLIEKFLKAGPMAQCPNQECKFKKPLPPVEEAVAAPVEAGEPVNVEAPV